MILETERLRIIPLELDLFYLLLNAPFELGKVLNVTNSISPLDDETQEAMQALYDEALEHEDNYLWYTNWQIVRKSDIVAIGSACFVGEPDEKGEVVIGYGINEPYRNKGYMTEAITAMQKWAFEQKGVKAVLAESDQNNVPSCRVLEKSGMIKFKTEGRSCFWKITCDK